MRNGTGERVRLWLVERTFSDDELNLIILTYARPDGSAYLRKERALTSFDEAHETPVAIEAAPDDLAPVPREDREAYAAEATRMAEHHDPGDVLD